MVKPSDSTAVKPVSMCITRGPSTTPNNAVVLVGDTLRVQSQESTCFSPALGMTWETADTTIAMVTGRGSDSTVSTAVVAARAPGNVVITARSVADTVVTGTIALTVKAP